MKGRKQRVAELCVQNNLDFIGIQESKKESFHENYLSSLAGGRNFCWKWLPSIGASGGILMGVNADLLEVLNWEVKTFSVSCTVKIGWMTILLLSQLSMALPRMREKKISLLNYLN